VEPAETVVARERICKRHVTAGYRGERGNVTIEELWEDVFCAVRAEAYNWSRFELAD
jgi:hypothetical protein